MNLIELWGNFCCSKIYKVLDILKNMGLEKIIRKFALITGISLMTLLPFPDVRKNLKDMEL